MRPKYTHTPGPWHVGGKGDSIVYATVDGGNYAVCNAVTFHGQPGFEDTANARLIAAAPELLDACRKMARLGGWTEKAPRGFTDTWESAVSAIAKAVHHSRK